MEGASSPSVRHATPRSITILLLLASPLTKSRAQNCPALGYALRQWRYVRIDTEYT